MKPLLPTLKEKKRYLVYELISERPLSNAEATILSHIKKTLGLFDGAKAGVLPVEYNSKTQQGVLRIAHTSVDKVKAALTLIKSVGSTPCAVRSLGVSGILKKTARFKKG